MKNASAPDQAVRQVAKSRSSRRRLGAVIDRFANEFTPKPGQVGFDAVGELIKTRRGA